MRKILIAIFTISTALQSFSQCLSSEESFKDYFNKNISTIEPIEGIWSANSTTKIYNQYNQLVDSKYSPQAAQWGIISDGNKFRACNLSGNDDNSTIVFSKTATNGVYLYQRTFSGSYDPAKANAIISSAGLLEYSYEVPQGELKYRMGNNYVNGISMTVEIKMIKLFPSLNDIQKSSPTSGTGFALSSDGFIVTNHHVVNGASNIIIRGINGDFSKTYKAKLIVEDKNNDIAILKIDDIAFNSFGIIPYVISNKSCDVGTSIFCLGYPLRATMGDEVKLTNGIISSKSGFQGDITTYQITAPVQPGNSGGPLFDDKGNLTGIINAKHLGAENVSYAIKTSYLINLIDIMPSAPKLQTISLLTGKSLSDQVKLIKNFTYIIETN
jgi:S1-C subfamily serine protease